MKLFIILFALSFQAMAATSWSINKDHTEVLFKIPFLGVSEINGSFSGTRGKVVFEDDSALVKEVEILIASDSIYTGNKIRDGHLKGADFFNSKKFPYIKFVSEKITPIEDGSFVALGKLSIAGNTSDFSVKFEVTDGVTDTWGYKNKFIKYKASIDREKYNLNWNKTLSDNKMMLGNIIEIWGIAQVQPSNEMTPSSHHMIPDSEQVRKREQYKRNELPEEKLQNFAIEEYQITAPEIKKEIVESVLEKQENYRDSLVWWLAYVSMGMIGFVATIFLCIEGKILFLRSKKKKYEEIGFYGFLSDMLVTPILMLYVWAMWHLGYGG